MLLNLWLLLYYLNLADSANSNAKVRGQAPLKKVRDRTSPGLPTALNAYGPIRRVREASEWTHPARGTSGVVMRSFVKIHWPLVLF